MIDESITILETVKDSKVVKRVSQSQFVKSRILEFERFLERILVRSLKKVVNPFKRKMNTLNWIMVNCLVIAYFFGKADASDLSYSQILYANFPMIGLYTIVANALAALAIGVGTILKYSAQIVLKFCGILLAAFVLYWLFKAIWRFIVENNSRTGLEETRA